MPNTTQDDDIDLWDHPAYAAVQRNARLAEQHREQTIRAQEKLLADRADAILSPRYTDAQASSAPGATALERALATIHAPAKAAPALPSMTTLLDRARAKPAPAKKPVERVTSAPVARTSGAPLTAMMGSNPAETFIRSAGMRGVHVERVKSFSGHKCSTFGCGYNAAWKLDGVYCCNGHHEAVLNRKAGGNR